MAPPKKRKPIIARYETEDEEIISEKVISIFSKLKGDIAYLREPIKNGIVGKFHTNKALIEKQQEIVASERNDKFKSIRTNANRLLILLDEVEKDPFMKTAFASTNAHAIAKNRKLNEYQETLFDLSTVACSAYANLYPSISREAQKEIIQSIQCIYEEITQRKAIKDIKKKAEDFYAGIFYDVVIDIFQALGEKLPDGRTIRNNLVKDKGK